MDPLVDSNAESGALGIDRGADGGHAQHPPAGCSRSGAVAAAGARKRVGAAFPRQMRAQLLDPGGGTR